MNDKYKLPTSNNPRQELSTKEGGNLSKKPVQKTENKHQGTIEKQKLEQIKNAGGVIKIAYGLLEIAKIRESTNAQVTIIEAKMREMEAEAKTYIQKLDADTSQLIIKGQIATSIIRETTVLINESHDLDANGKLEAIKMIPSLVSDILGN